jgi:hypothetical protein
MSIYDENADILKFILDTCMYIPTYIGAPNKISIFSSVSVLVAFQSKQNCSLENNSNCLFPFFHFKLCREAHF